MSFKFFLLSVFFEFFFYPIEFILKEYFLETFFLLITSVSSFLPDKSLTILYVARRWIFVRHPMMGGWVSSLTKFFLRAEVFSSMLSGGSSGEVFLESWSLFFNSFWWVFWWSFSWELKSFLQCFLVGLLVKFFFKFFLFFFFFLLQIEVQVGKEVSSSLSFILQFLFCLKFFKYVLKVKRKPGDRLEYLHP